MIRPDNVLVWATFLPVIGAVVILALMVVRHFLDLPKRFVDQAARWVTLVASFLMLADVVPGLALVRPQGPGAPRPGQGHRRADGEPGRLDPPLQRRVVRRRRRALHLDGAPHRHHLLRGRHRLHALVAGRREGHPHGRDGRGRPRARRRRAPPQALLGADGARLHDPAAAAHDRHDGHLRRPRHVPLLRLLGGHAPPDVLPHRRLGRPAPRVRGHQVLPLHPGGLGAHAARHHRRLLPQPAGGPGRRHAVGQAHLQPARAGRTGPRRPVRHGAAHPGLRLHQDRLRGASSSGSPSRSRCSPSTPGCPTPTSRPPPPSRSSWPASS